MDMTKKKQDGTRLREFRRCKIASVDLKQGYWRFWIVEEGAAAAATLNLVLAAQSRVNTGGQVSL